ncbi:hypothetical protein RFI_02670, partial [Reticulomyxa filosa]
LNAIEKAFIKKIDHNEKYYKFLIFHPVNQIKIHILMIFFTAVYVKVDKRKTLIKMKEWTFEELFCQNYYCLKCIQKIRNENVGFELANMEDNIIELDKD